MFQIKVVEKMKTHVMFNNFSENCAVYEITWKNMVEPDNPWMVIIQLMHLKCWISKATHTHTHILSLTHSKYVMLIVFHGISCFANAPECYITLALPVLF